MLHRISLAYPLYPLLNVGLWLRRRRLMSSHVEDGAPKAPNVEMGIQGGALNLCKQFPAYGIFSLSRSHVNGVGRSGVGRLRRTVCAGVLVHVHRYAGVPITINDNIAREKTTSVRQASPI